MSKRGLVSECCTCQAGRYLTLLGRRLAEQFGELRTVSAASSPLLEFCWSVYTREVAGDIAHIAC